MMREILFRGKSNWEYRNIKKGDWLYSMTIAPHCYSDEEITSYYIGGGNKTIDAKTLGQYTGLTDKNGKKIFEGDIVRCWGGEYAFGFWQYNHTFVLTDISNYMQMGELGESENIEVIGNIHDNAELLEEGEPDA